MASDIIDLERRIERADANVNSLCIQLSEMNSEFRRKLEEIALCGMFEILAQEEHTALSAYNPLLEYSETRLPVKTVGYVGNTSREAINSEAIHYKAATTALLISHARALCAHEKAYEALLKKATVEPLLPEKIIPKAIIQVGEPHKLLPQMFIANVYQGTYSPVPPTWEAQFRKLAEMGEANLYHIQNPSEQLPTKAVINYVIGELSDRYIDACIAAGMNGA